MWVFRFVRIACNVACPQGTSRNELGDLLRRWFGADAGMPGTGFKVTFRLSADGWSVAPATPAGVEQRVAPVVLPDTVDSNVIELVQSPPESDRFTRFVPVFMLEAAAGLWGPETAPEEAGWTDVSRFRPRQGMFVAKVRGRSMAPTIPDGSWCLFRKCPPGSREGRILLVQFNAIGDPETGGRYTVKKYHSEKTVTEESWVHQRIQLLPLNPDYDPIEIDPSEGEQMVEVGEFVGVV